MSTLASDCNDLSDNMVAILPHNRLICLLALWCTACLLVWAAASAGITGLLLAGTIIPLAAAVAFWLQRPMLIVNLVFWWYALAFISSSTYLPGVHQRFFHAIRYVDEALLLPLFFLVAMRYVFRLPVPPKAVVRLWIAFVVVTAVCGYIGGSGVKKTISYLQAYSRHVVLLVTASIYFSRERQHYRLLGRVLLGFIVAQFILNLAWLVGVNPIPNIYSGTRGPIFDQSVGTVGSSAYVTYVTVLGISFAVIYLMDARRLDLPRLQLWILFLLLCVAQLCLGYTKHAIPIAAASLTFVVLFAVRGRYVAKQCFLLLVAGTVALAAVTANLDYKRLQTSWYSSEHLDSALQIKRQVHQDVFRTLNTEKAWLQGMGPGQFSSVVAMWNLSPLFVRYFYYEIERNRYNPQGSIMYHPRSGLLSLLGEVGIMGTSLFLAMYLTAFFRIFRQFFTGKYDAEPWARCLALAWCGWAIFFALLNCLTDYLNFGILPVITWTGAGVLWVPPDPDVTGQDEREDDR